MQSINGYGLVLRGAEGSVVWISYQHSEDSPAYEPGTTAEFALGRAWRGWEGSQFMVDDKGQAQIFKTAMALVFKYNTPVIPTWNANEVESKIKFER